METNMKPHPSSSGINRRVLLLSGALLPISAPAIAQQVSQATDSGFSFAAYGDSRPMMYLPYKEGQPDLHKLFLDLFGLVLPEKVAEEVVKRDVKMIFDPVTKDLIQIDMPLYTGSEHTRLTLSEGWITEASVEDVKLLPAFTGRCSGSRAANGSRARS
jgi:hypothetical protein